MVFFWKFMGWLILYSLIYFSVLDVLGLAPGKENSILRVVLPLISFPGWWFSWKWFEKTFGPREPEPHNEGGTQYYFALRNAPVTYYLIVLKFFLLAMGANGIITLDHHEGGWRYFYIGNGILLYLYAIPFLIIKTKKLKISLTSSLILDSSSLRLQQCGETIVTVAFSDIQSVAIEENSRGALIDASAAKIYVGGQSAKGSACYTPGVNTIIEQLKQAVGDKFQSVPSIKDALKQAAFKPAF